MPQGKKTVTDKEIIQLLREHPDPAFTTGEVAEMAGMSTEGIRGRLEDLNDGGDIEFKKPSARRVIWWVPEDQSDVVKSR